MPTHFVLIDFESVQPDMLRLLSDDDRCKVIVFVGANQAKLPYELVNAMQRLGERGQYTKISGNGPNALDFHIAYYMGELAAKEPDAFFHVVSKDAGFDPLLQHLNGKSVLAERCTSIGEIFPVKPPRQESAEQRAQRFIAQLQQPKATRPRSEISLRRAIAASFRSEGITESEVGEVVDAMQATRFVSLVNGKACYQQVD